jgi:hypothetical protein
VWPLGATAIWAAATVPHGASGIAAFAEGAAPTRVGGMGGGDAADGVRVDEAQLVVYMWLLQIRRCRRGGTPGLSRMATTALAARRAVVRFLLSPA